MKPIYLCSKHHRQMARRATVRLYAGRAAFLLGWFLFCFAIAPLFLRAVLIESTGKHIPICAAYGLCDDNTKGQNND